jgi:sulfoxide reductase catalytic subunit YedY
MRVFCFQGVGRMQYFVRRPWDLPQREHTPADVFENRQTHRRDFLKQMGLSAAGIGLASSLTGCAGPTDEEIETAGGVDWLPKEFAKKYPAKRNATFEYGRPETNQRAAAEYTNFYEFSGSKDNWRHVSEFKPWPWSIEVGGLCGKPRTFDMDDIYRLFRLEERAYRHRCVETWAMCVPWTGFPFAELLKRVEPNAKAKFVAIESFVRPKEAPAMSNDSFPWPYTEGLTVDEAMNEMTFLATGVYGEALPKQHGAPLRLVVPWKYGFKSIKSPVRIILTDRQPLTFWNGSMPHEYGFEANVEPDVPHPRWSQATEWMLGTRKEYDSVIYNGYGEYVGGLYS